MSRDPADTPAPLHYSNLPDVTPNEGKLLAASGGAIILTFVSFVVVAKSANDEPYTWGVQAGDVILQVIAAACLLGWLVYIAAAANELRRRRRTYAVIVATLVWSSINLFYLGVTIIGYVQDVTK